MRFIVSSSALFNRLQTIGRVINSKNTLPILDCFLFEIQDNILTITASDSETTLITNLNLWKAMPTPVSASTPKPSKTP